MAEYVSRLDDGDETKLRVLGNTAATGDGSSNGTFFRAVLLVRRGKVTLSFCFLQFFCISWLTWLVLLLHISMMKHVNMLKEQGNAWPQKLLHWLVFFISLLFHA